MLVDLLIALTTTMCRCSSESCLIKSPNILSAVVASRDKSGAVFDNCGVNHFDGGVTIAVFSSYSYFISYCLRESWLSYPLQTLQPQVESFVLVTSSLVEAALNHYTCTNIIIDKLYCPSFLRYTVHDTQACIQTVFAMMTPQHGIY